MANLVDEIDERVADHNSERHGKQAISTRSRFFRVTWQGRWASKKSGGNREGSAALRHYPATAVASCCHSVSRNRPCPVSACAKSPAILGAADSRGVAQPGSASALGA